ncbi:MAG: sigma-70 family RNA polymerase sigma factor [Desulfatitalea sp.]|nr:sigma-70 family RNA polymerase sigma factor [Desulfatitalea sp.]NNJ99274.1 sigma-70 family RNA polymerase sigma factor [Desulfatitalea sp.]
MTTVSTRPPATNDPDHELIEGIRNGGQELFSDLVSRYQRALYNFGMKMCGEPGDAEDLVQETFLNVFKYLPGFRQETKFKNWLYRIAASVCIKKRRRSKFAPKRELSLEEFLPADEAAVQTQVPQWAAMPLDQVLNEELGRQLKTAILDLPEKYRVVLVLRDIEGFSTEETAQILNLTPSNVKVRLHRARLFLRDRLRGYFSDE